MPDGRARAQPARRPPRSGRDAGRRPARARCWRRPRTASRPRRSSASTAGTTTAGGRHLPALLRSADDRGRRTGRAPLDKEILAPCWLTPARARRRRRADAPLAAGPAVRGRLPRRAELPARACCRRPMAEKVVVGMSGGVDSVGGRAAAQARGLRRRRPVHEELGGRRRRRVLLHAPGPDRRGGGGGRDRHRPGGGEFRRRVQGARVRELPRRVRGRPHAQPGRAVQRRDQVQGLPRPRAWRWARRASPPGTTRRLRERDTARWSCSRRRTRRKDQSYFLHRLNQAQLARVLFPLGRPEEGRGAPHRARGRAAEPRQEGFDRHLLHRRAAVPRVPQPLPAARRRVRCATPEGRRVGEHIGLAFYTIGQSKGIGLGGARGEPWYVADKASGPTNC